MSDIGKIIVIGAGRMGRGIGLAYGLAGVETILVDIKARNAAQQEELAMTLQRELSRELTFLVDIGLINESQKSRIEGRIHLESADSFSAHDHHIECVFEAVPEHEDAKTQAFAYMSSAFSTETLIASTTSTFLVDDLATRISNPERYANAHWLNPAHLMPLVEISRGSATHDEAIAQLRTSLETIGKQTIICGASPGYIVPRVQALAMNEAARLVEENVASAEDIDKAIRTGFGVRYAILGLLEFIDWGGGDILYYASDYLSKTVDADRYKAPDIIQKNMVEGRNGLSDGVGFYDYNEENVEDYRRARISSFVSLLQHLKLAPKISD